jgi:DNA-binding response OmpR family regulator
VALCASIRANARVESVPILCASSLVAIDDRLRALRAGVDVFLPKPVHADLFLDVATQLLRAGSHARRTAQAFIDTRRM